MSPRRSWTLRPSPRDIFTTRKSVARVVKLRSPRWKHGGRLRWIMIGLAHGHATPSSPPPLSVCHGAMLLLMVMRRCGGCAAICGSWFMPHAPPGRTHTDAASKPHAHTDYTCKAHDCTVQ